MLVVPSETCVSSSRQHEALVPSEYEERMWLRQQQSPAENFSRLMAFRLAGAVDPARLRTAVSTLLRLVPGLDVRYRFDDDGLLLKVPGQFQVPESWGRPVDSPGAALNILVGEQARPWDLEAEAPLRFHLSRLGDEGAVLGVVVHRILDGAVSWGRFFALLSRLYGGADHGDGLDLIVTRAGTMARPEESGLSWLLRPRGADLVDHSRESWLDAEIRQRAGGRFCAVINAASVSRQDGSSRAVLAALTVSLGRFLLRLGGGEDLKIVVVEGGVELGLPLAACASLRLLLRRDDDPRQAVGALLAGGESCAGSADGQGIEVTWLADAAEFLALPGMTSQRVAVPSLDGGGGLCCGLAVGADGRVVVELATGGDASPHAGALLLERFLAFLQGDERAAELVAPAPRFPEPRPVESPVKDVTGLILEEFRQALALPNMTADDDFFDMGGHSLIATRVIGRLLSTHGIGLQINDLFGSPTAASLARHAQLRDADGAFAAVASATAAADAPLSLAQQSLWKVYAAFGYGEIFNIPFALRFLDKVDESVFQRAFLDLMERHPVLRSLFAEEGGVARQRVVPLAELGQYKWFWSSDESAGLADRNREAGHRFDLGRELPLRLRFMIDEATGQQVLSLLFQHVVLDEWSVNLLMDELEHAYGQRLSGVAPRWRTQPPPFHHFAAKQRGAGLNTGHVSYWTDRLRGVAMGQPLFPRKSGDGTPETSSAAGGWVELKLDSPTVEGLYALAKNTGASLFNVVYAAIATALHFLGAPDDLAIGTSASGRTDADFFDTVGYFTTVVCHRLRIAEDVSLAGLVRQVRDTVNDSLPYSDIPIDLVEEELGFDSIQHGGHMFGVFIQLHAKNKLNGAFTLADGRRVAFRQVDPEKSESLLGLHYEVMEETIDGERTIRVMMSYRADLYDNEQVEAIRRTTCQLFSRFATADADQRLASLRTAG